MDRIIIILIFFLSSAAIWLVILAGIALIEKRMVWPYGDPQPQPKFGRSSGYGDRWVKNAVNAGFTFLGWAPDLKRHFKVDYAMLVSPQHDCFALIGVGKVMATAVNGTWLYSRATDDRVFYTTDNQSCVEWDSSRRWKSQLMPSSSFRELYQHHQKLLTDYHVPLQPFSPGREMEEFRQMREEHYQAMSHCGLISYTDGTATQWRYTIYGAFKWAIFNLFIGLLRALTFGRFPRCA